MKYLIQAAFILIFFTGCVSTCRLNPNEPGFVKGTYIVTPRDDGRHEIKMIRKHKILDQENEQEGEYEIN